MLPDFIKEPSDLAGYYVYLELSVALADVELDIEASYASKEELFTLMQYSEVFVDGNIITIVLDVI